MTRHVLLDELKSAGYEVAELFTKQGRSRVTSYGVDGTVSHVARERGWAVRAGREDRSLFVSSTGRARAMRWPVPRGSRLRLPPAQRAGERSSSSPMAPLLGESDSRDLLSRLVREVESTSSRPRILNAQLLDGQSERSISNSFGTARSSASRLARVELWCRIEGRGGAASISFAFAAASARELEVPDMARQVDRVAAARRGARWVERTKVDVVLAPEVATALLGPFSSRLLGQALCDLPRRPGARSTGGRSDRVAHDCVTLRERPANPMSLLAAPFDGEGTPSRDVTLVDAGRIAEPFLPWWRQGEPSCAYGSMVRTSFREPPRFGFSALELSAGAEPPASLLARVGSGCFVLGAQALAVFDERKDRFSLPAFGLEVSGGELANPIGPCVLHVNATDLLSKIRGVADDLRFDASQGFIAAPSVLLRGVDVTSVR